MSCIWPDSALRNHGSVNEVGAICSNLGVCVANVSSVWVVGSEWGN